MGDSLREIWKSTRLTRTEKVMLWLGWTPSKITRSITCAWCGEEFTWSGDTTGDPPRFCGPTHKMRSAKARTARVEGAQPKKRKAAPVEETPPSAPKAPVVTVAKAVPIKPATCRCKNHMGTPKQKYDTQDAAITQIMRRHLEHGAHRIYKCPSAEFWHVTSQVPRG